MRIGLIRSGFMGPQVAPRRGSEAMVERWFVKKEEMVLGPYTLEELRGYVARGKVTALDLVSRDGKAGWTTIHQVPQLDDVAREAAVPPPRLGAMPAVPARAWYVAQGDQAVGPLDLDALRAALAQGQVRFDNQACEVGATAWGTVNGIAEIADLLPPSIPSSGVPSNSSSDASPAIAPVPSSPSVRFYTPWQTWVAAWLGSWIVGAVLVIRNERVLGRNTRARLIVIATILSAVGFLVLNALLPDTNVLPRFVGLALATVPYAYAKSSQKQLVDQHVSAGGTVHSWWRVLGFGLASAVCLLVMFFAFSPAPETLSTTHAGETTAPAAGMPSPPVVPPPPPSAPVETIDSRGQEAMAAVAGYLNAEQRMQPREPYWCGPEEMPGRFHNLISWRIRPDYIRQRRQDQTSLPEWFRFTVDLRATNTLGGILTNTHSYYVKRFTDGTYRLLAQCEDDSGCEGLLSADAIVYSTRPNAPCAFPRDHVAAPLSGPIAGGDDANGAMEANAALPPAGTEAFDFRRLAIERSQFNGTVQLCRVSHAVGPIPISTRDIQLGLGLDNATVRLDVFCSPPPETGPLMAVLFTAVNQAQSLDVRRGSTIAVEITPSDYIRGPVLRFRETR